MTTKGSISLSIMSTKILSQAIMFIITKASSCFGSIINTPKLFQKNYVDIEFIERVLGIPREHLQGEEWKLSEPIGEGFHYMVKGFDCDGVPNFSHCTSDYCARFEDVNQFEPLTVGMVVKWFGWFLYQLRNSVLAVEQGGFKNKN